MTFYQPNPDVRPTGAEVAEFADPDPPAAARDDEDQLEEQDPDPKARPSGAPPVQGD